MSRGRTNLMPVLQTISLHEARDLLLTHDADLQIIPTPSRELLLATVDKVITAAEDLAVHVDDPNELLRLDGARRNATKIIATTSGVPASRLTQILGSTDAEPAHLTRNVLLTLILVGVASYNGSARDIVEEFPKLQPRTRALGRPHRDDEALLLRVWGLFLSNGDGHARRTAAIYGMCDAGLAAGETGLIYPHNVAVYANNTGLLEVPAHGTTAQRDIELSKYSSTLIWRYANQYKFGPTERFTWRPRNQVLKLWDKEIYVNMSASASGVIALIHQTLGLDHADTTAASIWMWRAQTITDLEGTKAAARICGHTPDNLIKLLATANNPWRKKRVHHKTAAKKARPTFKALA